MSSYYVLKIQYVNRPPETRNISAPTTSVGRETGDIVLNDPQTSGRHAEIVFQGGQVRVRDAGSTNGTWFNGQRLTEFAMEAGQWFQVGQTTLQLMAVHGAAAPGPSSGPAKTMMAMGAPPPAAGPAAAPGSAPAGWAPPGGAAPPPGPSPAAAAPPGYPPSQPGGGGYPPSQPGGGGYPPSQPGGGGYPPSQQAAPGMGPGPGGPPPGMGPGPGGPPPGMGPGPGAPPPGMGPGPGGPPPGMGPGPGAPPPGMAPGGPPPGMPAPGMGPGPGMGPAPGQAPGPMAPMGASAPMGAAPGMAPMGMGGGGVRPNFQGSGGELLVTCIVGGLLTIITAYIYLPWFVCKLARYVASNTTLGPTRRGELRVEFTGTGGELFVTYLVGALLSVITIGIYLPWFMCKMLKFFSDNTQAVAPDGTRYRLAFEGTGGELFVTYLVGAILSAITLYIYVPWFMCKLTKWVYSNMRILENEQPVGSLDFEGTGGELFVTYLVGMLLTVLTLSIYLPWFQVKLTKFFTEGTRVNYQGRMFQGQFHGTGGEYFVIMLLHGFLTAITLYIYFPWFLVKQWEFNINNREFTELGGAGGGMGGPAFQPQMPMQMPMR